MQTPTEVLAVRLANLEAELQLKAEQVLHLAAELRLAESELRAAGLRSDPVPHVPVKR